MELNRMECCVTDCYTQKVRYEARAVPILTIGDSISAPQYWRIDNGFLNQTSFPRIAYILQDNFEICLNKRIGSLDTKSFSENAYKPFAE